MRKAQSMNSSVSMIRQTAIEWLKFNFYMYDNQILGRIRDTRQMMFIDVSNISQHVSHIFGSKINDTIRIILECF